MKYTAGKGVSFFLLLMNVLVVILISGSLRSPITAIGPVLDEVRNSLHLNRFQSSLLTSIPLFIFAGCSVVISRFSRRFSINRFLLYALIILSFGLFVRVSGSISALFLGSVFIGLGIAIGNVIIPGYIKNNFPKQIGLMTGVFAVSMNLAAALASGYSVRIGQWTGYGWRGSLGIWLVIALLALLVVVLELIFNKNTLQQQKTDRSTSDFNMFKSAQAWNISLFMGLQSLVYYCIVSWLPAVLGDYGMTGNAPGWVLFTIQIASIPITFFGPIIANKMIDQKGMVIFVCVSMLISILMFIWLKSDSVYFTAILLGISNGLSFSLSILFFSLRTKSSANAIKISGMAQSVGYLIAALGPPVFGKLHDLDSSWQSSFYFLVAAILLMFLFGFRAASRRYVED
ncbi:MFS transporter [Chryseobacterium lactis]|uniref:MFS transporter n=1 Tax=Chryseobacterium lactis TaxID=1241981 RepID=A0A3G6RKJ1_CHRLC|nr:MFS transporter [Chryseobacterium lactis]AZA84360.1 MFS transporter [Chryseobacterium lactis]AZB04748.1 MFS transporter [Chryseobacterium lactis]PNW14478.1 MFS transporter [Chryseobacterium lactis]